MWDTYQPNAILTYAQVWVLETKPIAALVYLDMDSFSWGLGRDRISFGEDWTLRVCPWPVEGVCKGIRLVCCTRLLLWPFVLLLCIQGHLRGLLASPLLPRPRPNAG